MIEKQDESNYNGKSKPEERLRLELRKGKNKKIALFILGAALTIAAILFAVYVFCIVPGGKYKAAVQLKEEGHYQEAISAFEAMNGYKDSDEYIKNCYQSILGEE